ncbi:DUF6118 family protein [Sphingobium sp. Ndbn-10]|uniref:DUF6118 family protein n=1 Tax=Sphingobium sp. Ndbn-10 TaxID=1667223 RepID=UPI0008187EE9|nr:DUF6118 family protein [Sphingobium sp. Ndbn-10]
MDDDREDMDEDGAARAFTQLGREVSLLRAAIEGLTAARDSIEIPDYEPTLERTEKILLALTQRVDAISKSPAMTLTPETMGQRLNASVADATAELRNLVNSTRNDMSAATRDLQGLAVSRRDRWAQDRWLVWTGLGGALLGVLFYAALAGPIARLTPDSWLWPEGMATRALGSDSQWDAGQRLMRTASPDIWNGLVAATNLVRDNHDAIEACRKSAGKAKKAVRCAIEVKAGE